MEGSEEDMLEGTEEAPEEDLDVDRYIARKAEYFWGFGGALEYMKRDKRAINKMVSNRYRYEMWMWQNRIPGLRINDLENVYRRGAIAHIYRNAFTLYSEMIEHFGRDRHPYFDG